MKYSTLILFQLLLHPFVLFLLGIRITLVHFFVCLFRIRSTTCEADTEIKHCLYRHPTAFKVLMQRKKKEKLTATRYPQLGEIVMWVSSWHPAQWEFGRCLHVNLLCRAAALLARGSVLAPELMSSTESRLMRPSEECRDSSSSALMSVRSCILKLRNLSDSTPCPCIAINKTHIRHGTTSDESNVRQKTLGN